MDQRPKGLRIFTLGYVIHQEVPTARRMRSCWPGKRGRGVGITKYPLDQELVEYRKWQTNPEKQEEIVSFIMAQCRGGGCYRNFSCSIHHPNVIT